MSDNIASARVPVPIAELLDLVDDASEYQRQMHQHLRDGFLALAREWYRDPSSVVRMYRPTFSRVLLLLVC